MIIDRFTVAAVVVTVAVPRCRNAAVIVGAEEAVPRARALGAYLRTLIRVVAAVVIAVAEPERFNTDVGRVALEVARRTRSVPFAALASFIRCIGVLAVIDSIANLSTNRPTTRNKLHCSSTNTLFLNMNIKDNN